MNEAKRKGYTKFPNTLKVQGSSARKGYTKFPNTLKVQGSSAWRILDLTFVGYFNSIPSFDILQFFNFSEFSEFRVTSRDPMGAMLYGSDVVRNAMYLDMTRPAPDSVFAPVKTMGINPSLEDAKDYLTGYIAACSSDLARQLDYEKTKDTGGHIHVAKITQKDGFEWMIAPLRDSSSSTEP